MVTLSVSLAVRRKLPLRGSKGLPRTLLHLDLAAPPISEGPMPLLGDRDRRRNKTSP